MAKDDTSNGGTQQSENSLCDQWSAVSSLLRAEIGEAAYQSWLKPMTIRGISDGEVKISVPTRFMRDWIVAHYVDQLGQLWGKQNPDVKGVEVFIQSDREEVREETRKNLSKDAPAAAEGGDRNNYRVEIGAPLDRRFTFEHFVVFSHVPQFASAAL